MAGLSARWVALYISIMPMMIRINMRIRAMGSTRRFRELRRCSMYWLPPWLVEIGPQYLSRYGRRHRTPVARVFHHHSDRDGRFFQGTKSEKERMIVSLGVLGRPGFTAYVNAVHPRISACTAGLDDRPERLDEDHARFVFQVNVSQRVGLPGLPGAVGPGGIEKKMGFKERGFFYKGAGIVGELDGGDHLALTNGGIEYLTFCPDPSPVLEFFVVRPFVEDFSG